MAEIALIELETICSIGILITLLGTAGTTLFGISASGASADAGSKSISALERQGITRTFCRKLWLLRHKCCFGLVICLRSDIIRWNYCRKGDAGSC